MWFALVPLEDFQRFRQSLRAAISGLWQFSGYGVDEGLDFRYTILVRNFSAALSTVLVHGPKFQSGLWYSSYLGLFFQWALGL